MGIDVALELLDEAFADRGGGGDERRVFVDLGAGDGRVVAAAAARGVYDAAFAIEGDERLWPIVEANLAPFPSARLLKADLFDSAERISSFGATDIFFYLSPDGAARLSKALPLGCRVITAEYELASPWKLAGQKRALDLHYLLFEAAP